MIQNDLELAGTQERIAFFPKSSPKCVFAPNLKISLQWQAYTWRRLIKCTPK